MQPLTAGQTGDLVSALFFCGLGLVGIVIGLLSVLQRDRAVEVYNWIEVRRFRSRLRLRTRTYALAMGIGLVMWGVVIATLGIVMALVAHR